MFDKNYYCLVAGLREYSLDADTKGFNARAIIEEILEGVSARDARCVRLLYGYYDCENLVNFRKGRAAHNPLGNLSREEIEEQTKNPDRLPARMATVVRSYSAIVDEDADNEDGIDTDQSFENALFSAYYDECAHSKSRFLRQWADFDRNLRNISAAVVARVTGRSAEESVVGGDEISQQAQTLVSRRFRLAGRRSLPGGGDRRRERRDQPGGEGAQDRCDPLEPSRRASPLSTISTSTHCWLTW